MQHLPFFGSHNKTIYLVEPKFQSPTYNKILVAYDA